MSGSVTRLEEHRTALTGHCYRMLGSPVDADPLFSHILFPTYVAAFIWGGLWLREPRLRALVPVRSAK